MSRLNFSSIILLTVSLLALFITHTIAADISGFDYSLEKKYSTAHSLGDNYRFDPRDGWQTINVTNLQYKYSRSDKDNGADNAAFEESSLRKRSSKKSKSSHKKATSKSISPSSNGLVGSIKSVLDSLKGIGSAEPVTITWYTGQDLLNPSCWSNPTWAPTDESFACALTLDGWTNRPKCFKFLELCNSPNKCVFVRVVDTCAGCAEGSKHVDLTKSAFTQLANLNEGVLTVQMRLATDPDGWLENLWGPKVN